MKKKPCVCPVCQQQTTVTTCPTCGHPLPSTLPPISISQTPFLIMAMSDEHNWVVDAKNNQKDAVKLAIRFAQAAPPTQFLVVKVCGVANLIQGWRKIK